MSTLAVTVSSQTSSLPVYSVYLKKAQTSVEVQRSDDGLIPRKAHLSMTFSLPQSTNRLTVVVKECLKIPDQTMTPVGDRFLLLVCS